MKITFIYLQVHKCTEDPSYAWDQIKVQKGRIHQELDIPALDLPRPADTVRFVCISDTHSRMASIMPNIPDGDVLIHAG